MEDKEKIEDVNIQELRKYEEENEVENKEDE